MIVYFDNENSLVDTIEHIESFQIFKQGQIMNIKKNSKDFEIIKKELNTLFFESRLVPALSVSLHNETQQALNDGEWLQINFDQELNKSGLLFVSLLFRLEKTSGFNLIRVCNGKYEGRCLFVNLETEIDLNSLLK